MIVDSVCGDGERVIVIVDYFLLRSTSPAYGQLLWKADGGCNILEVRPILVLWMNCAIGDLQGYEDSWWSK
jgi:hypothetical protein